MSGKFPVYKLTDKQIRGIANIVLHEQGTVAGWFAEASQIANRTDIWGDSYATPENAVATVKSGWYAKGASRYEAGTSNQTVIDIVKLVFCKGYRTLPRYINEHDCMSDIFTVKNGSVNVKSDKSKWKQFVTIIKNKMGSTYIFYAFPGGHSSGVDPFGYTDKSHREKWGDFCYTVDEVLAVKAEMESKNTVTESDITLIGHGSGNPSTKNMHTYLESRHKQKASNGKTKGIVAVKRLKAMDDNARVNFVTIISQTIGRNIYNQNLREFAYTKHNGKYYSDCSSLLMATLKKLGYNVSLLNTAGIYQSALFETVPVTIKNGHIIDPGLLKIGDGILFRGNDPSRPLQIGHVESVYQIGASSGKTKYPDVLPALPPRGYWKIGDGKTSYINYPTQIKRLQKFLNWALNLKLEIDGIIGRNTRAAIIAFEKKCGLTQDGLFGRNCLEMAKKYSI